MRLQRRERFLVSMAVSAIGIFLFIEFLIFPFQDRREVLIRGIEAKKTALKELSGLRARYVAYKAGAEGIEARIRRRAKGFALFSFLEQAAGRSGVKDHIKYMRPSVMEGSGPFTESMVEMKLDDITLQQLVAYLYVVESPKDVVGIKRMSIKDSERDPGYLNAIIQVVTFVHKNK